MAELTKSVATVVNSVRLDLVVLSVGYINQVALPLPQNKTAPAVELPMPLVDAVLIE